MVPVSKPPMYARDGDFGDDGTLWRCLGCGDWVKDPTESHSCRKKAAA